MIGIIVILNFLKYSMFINFIGSNLNFSGSKLIFNGSNLNFIGSN